METLRSYFFLVWAISGIQSAHATPADTSDQRKPHIIVIMADDMGYSDLGCYGGEAFTPNLDRLARGGLRFRTFYNAARCCPSRAALLTGVYPHEAGMGEMVSEVNSVPDPGPYQGYLSDRTVTIAEALKPAGYISYLSGKWHVGEKPEHWPRRRGFDRYFGLISGASSYFELVDEPRVRQMVHDDEPWMPPEDGFYMTDAFSDTAVAFVEQHMRTAKEAPFFLYLAYTAPHWPLHAPEADVKRYKGMFDDGWDEVRKRRFERMRALGVIDDDHHLSPRPADIPPWESVDNPANWARRMEVYTAMIDRMDQGIGKLLSALERLGELDNTLIFFLSDNGGCDENIDGRELNQLGSEIGKRGSYIAYDKPWANVSNTPYRQYKSWTHEGGMITPFIAHWPAGIKRHGQSTETVGHIVDLMATCLDVAGLQYPERFNEKLMVPLRGESLMPAFEREKAKSRTLYWEHFGKKAVRSGDWKLVSGGKEQPWELYNLIEDPVELNDIAAQHPEIVEQLRHMYAAWADGAGVKK
ncbi:MAG: arylsulfatase [Parapedobacter sp.]|nr:MAG: arylsulfatase [Parapedobacter sp.]